MRPFYFGTNTKMYKSSSETRAFLQELASLTTDIDSQKHPIFVLPSLTALESAIATALERKVLLGAQNMHGAEEGQYTGEVSARMLADIKADLVMVAHSERRQVFGETDLSANTKVLRAIAHSLRVLLCIGETAEQKAANVSREALRMQLLLGLQGVNQADCARLWIAYEPVWAIGVGGQPAEKDYVDRCHGWIHELLEERFGTCEADIPVLYGGSVNAQNALEYAVLETVDGLFIGRSAWNAQAFSGIIHEVSALRQERLG